MYDAIPTLKYPSPTKMKNRFGFGFSMSIAQAPNPIKELNGCCTPSTVPPTFLGAFFCMSCVANSDIKYS